MDLIGRQSAIELVRDVCDAILSQCGSHYDGEDEVYDSILEVNAILKCNKEIRIALECMPSAEPVIRCKDCKFYDHFWNGDWCSLKNIDVKDANDFCSRAERRTDE